MRDVLHDKAMTTVYRDDESYAETVLAAVIADGDQAELAILLRQLALIGTD
ncbi:TPA: transcriptional regulator [Escherichia coli]|nr:transcriptional regulator [Escherichia coli]